MKTARLPRVRVEVAYATPQVQHVIPLEVPAGTSAWEAVRLSGIGARCPELRLEQARIGIYGMLLADPRGRTLETGERVELDRPPRADPKRQRRRRAGG